MGVLLRYRFKVDEVLFVKKLIDLDGLDKSIKESRVEFSNSQWLCELSFFEHESCSNGVVLIFTRDESVDERVRLTYWFDYDSEGGFFDFLKYQSALLVDAGEGEKRVQEYVSVSTHLPNHAELTKGEEQIFCGVSIVRIEDVGKQLLANLAEIEVTEEVLSPRLPEP